MVAMTLTTLCGIFWTLTYVLIIRQGFRDRTYGMPLAALSANISWEFIHGFVRPHPPLQRGVDIVWFLFDAVILYQIIRFGRRELRLGRAVFAVTVGGTLAVAFGTVLLMGSEFDDPQGFYSAYGQSILMSALFLAMLHSRRSSAGQSAAIAWSKFLGTAFASVGLAMWPETPQGTGLIPFAFVVCAVLDIAYIVALRQVQRTEPDRTSARPAPHERDAGAHQRDERHVRPDREAAQ